MTAGLISHKIPCFGYIIKEVDKAGALLADECARRGLHFKKFPGITYSLYTPYSHPSHTLSTNPIHTPYPHTPYNDISSAHHTMTPDLHITFRQNIHTFCQNIHKIPANYPHILSNYPHILSKYSQNTGKLPPMSIHPPDVKLGIDVVLDDGTVVKAEELTGEPLKGRKIVYLGDTSDASNLIEAAKDCDILVHEATTDDARMKDCAKLGHATPLVAARMALRCNARRLGNLLRIYLILFSIISKYLISKYLILSHIVFIHP